MNMFDFFDYQLQFSPFATTANQPSWKKTSSNPFDGFMTRFDEIMIRHLPHTEDFMMSPTNANRPTIMSYLVDRMRFETDILMRKIESARVKEAEKTVHTKERCLSIAFRIGNGEKVSVEDLLFLAHNDPELYDHALKLKQEKEDAGNTGAAPAGNTGTPGA